MGLARLIIRAGFGKGKIRFDRFVNFRPVSGTGGEKVQNFVAFGPWIISVHKLAVDLFFLPPPNTIPSCVFFSPGNFQITFFLALHSSLPKTSTSTRMSLLTKAYTRVPSGTSLCM
jgi:hypothetical protein